MEGLSPIIELVAGMIGILVISAMVLAFSKRFRMPFSVALVLVGIAINLLGKFAPDNLQAVLSYKISPDFIFYVCLPTLLFESAFAIDPRQLRRNLVPILTLAIPGLLLSTVLIAAIVSVLTPISFLHGLLLGAILSATDPIAVVALFRQLGAPKRLTVLVEGESLFNDATSIVTSKLILGIILAGVFTSQHFYHGVSEFFIEFFGGIAVGWIIAIGIGFVLGKVKSDPEIEISLTTILAYGTFLIAQNYAHVSGVMATVTAGLTLSGWGRAKISPSVHQYLEHFWEFLAYFANALIFLLVGLSINLGEVWGALDILVVVAIAMLISRAAITYGLMPIVGKLPGGLNIDLRYQTAIFWGGLRGAIALGIVLSLPPFGNNNLFIVLVTGSVLFTLLVQGLTMEKVVNLLGLDTPPLSDRIAKEEGQLSATKQALTSIPELQQGGFFSARIAADIQKECEDQLNIIQQRIEQLRADELNETEETRLLYLRALATEKTSYYQMFAKGHLTEMAYRDLVDGLATQLDQLRFTPNPGAIRPAFIQRSDWWRTLLIRTLERLPGMRDTIGNLRSKRISQEYEESWGQHQGYAAAIEYLNDMIYSESQDVKFATEVRDRFMNWQEELQFRIDAITEQFPEFVTAMQNRLANRMVLQAEYDAITKQAASGTLPADVAKVIQDELSNRIHQLRESSRTKIILDPTELLKKVPFCAAIPEEDYPEVIKLLQERLAPAGKAIITEGEKGTSLFLIMRGVVRVCRNFGGFEKDINTFFAGDFFGEMALLHSEPRTATCRAVTPCSLYELTRADFEKIKAKYPEVQAAVEKADRERRQTQQQSSDTS